MFALAVVVVIAPALAGCGDDGGEDDPCVCPLNETATFFVDPMLDRARCPGLQPTGVEIPYRCSFGSLTEAVDAAAASPLVGARVVGVRREGVDVATFVVDSALAITNEVAITTLDDPATGGEGLEVSANRYRIELADTLTIGDGASLQGFTIAPREGAAPATLARCAGLATLVGMQLDAGGGATDGIVVEADCTAFLTGTRVANASTGILVRGTANLLDVNLDDNTTGVAVAASGSLAFRRGSVARSRSDAITIDSAADIRNILVGPSGGHGIIVDTDRTVTIADVGVFESGTIPSATPDKAGILFRRATNATLTGDLNSSSTTPPTIQSNSGWGIVVGDAANPAPVSVRMESIEVVANAGGGIVVRAGASVAVDSVVIGANKGDGVVFHTAPTTFLRNRSFNNTGDQLVFDGAAATTTIATTSCADANGVFCYGRHGSFGIATRNGATVTPGFIRFERETPMVGVDYDEGVLVDPMQVCPEVGFCSSTGP